MFETSVVRAQAQARGGRFSLLTLSIIAHSAVIVGAVAISVASVDFPTQAPDEVQAAPLFLPVTLPPPLGRPDAAQPQQPPRQAQPAPVSQPAQMTAPTQVPDTVTPVDAPVADPGTGSGDQSGVPDTPGVPWGVRDSLGPIDAPIVNAPIVEPRIYQPHEVKAPVLVHKVEPPYPNALLRTGMQATVVVRCVIDKNGRVRDPIIVTGAMRPFEEAVINAVQQWRYTPGSLRGEAVESYLDVTVRFSVKR